MKVKMIIRLSIVCFLIFSLLGCEAFVRKFTRKRKKENLPKEELVLAPEEYKVTQMTKEELYRQYFLFWRSWHDELIGALYEGANRKKQKDCLNEMVKNLKQLRLLLNDEKKAKLDVYINQIKELDEIIAQDLYGNNIAVNRLTAEQIKRNILRDFSYSKVKDYLS